MGAPGWIYILRSFDRLISMPPDTFICKIGRSIDPRFRWGQLVVGTAHDLHQWTLIKVADAVAAEKFYHEKYRDKWLRREWFALSQADLDHLFQTTHYPSILEAEIAHADCPPTRQVTKKPAWLKKPAMRLVQLAPEEIDGWQVRVIR